MLTACPTTGHEKVWCFFCQLLGGMLPSLDTYIMYASLQGFAKVTTTQLISQHSPSPIFSAQQYNLD